MDQALKQRLIGAAVLVALAVIFIPMLLEAPEPEATTRIASGLADTSFSACGVTLVSVRAKRSVATSFRPAGSRSLLICLNQSSP